MLSRLGHFQFDLGHDNWPCRAPGPDRFGKKLTRFEKHLSLAGLRAFRHQLKTFHHQLLRLFGIARTLEYAGKRQIFGNGLLQTAKPFINHCQPGMCEEVVGLEGGDTHPVLEGLIHLVLIEKPFGGLHG